ncbi:MAG: adenosylmethionine decarboxylase [Desulfatibacillaceae bacterium]
MVTDDALRFEGPEKKLEIILTAPRPDLRGDDPARWDRVVRASRATILSKKSTPDMDAWLLSESSLFVWDDRILMITCGRTTLIHALPEILAFVDREEVGFVFYERKNLMYPTDQQSDFEQDVAYLETFFQGKSYRLGPANRDHVHVFYSSHAQAPPDEDATLEVLMHGLAPEALGLFDESAASTAEGALALSGIDRIYPDMERDSFLFSPCGLSVNAVEGASYHTIHVTPQACGSYASFETNVVESDYGPLLDQLLSIFRPSTLTIVLTTSLPAHGVQPRFPGVPEGYHTTERSTYEFDCGYAVTHANLTI